MHSACARECVLVCLGVPLMTIDGYSTARARAPASLACALACVCSERFLFSGGRFLIQPLHNGHNVNHKNCTRPFTMQHSAEDKRGQKRTAQHQTGPLLLVPCTRYTLFPFLTKAGGPSVQRASGESTACAQTRAWGFVGAFLVV